MSKGGISLYIDLQKHKLDQIAARISLDKRIAFSKYSYGVRRKTYKGRYVTRDKNLPTVLADSSNHSRAQRHNIECTEATRSQLSKRHILSLKSKYLRLKKPILL